MLKSIEAVMHPDGSLSLGEEFHPAKTCRVIVTVLTDETPVPASDLSEPKGGVGDRFWSNRVKVTSPIEFLSRDQANERFSR